MLGVTTIEKTTEEQILEELKSINRRLKAMEDESDDRPSSVVFGMVKSFFTGVFIVGVIAVVFGLLQVLGSWIL
ncbi:hypothetical protein [Guptibacillus algicola]|uniref:hypothetical protein n=1 Tax=Guptibacillus algicola TaxID=225844 RepID=UPI001CD5753C|nr:hypothetical protein [Alkalihalobacillus algicola]MCA0987447.1 hypothetical protein [Alkalihalobacillus algicola]